MKYPKNTKKVIRPKLPLDSLRFDFRLKIRIQRKKLHMVAPGENHFRRNFEMLHLFLDFESYIVKNSTKSSFSGFGSVKKRFFMAKSCLEHISKLILIGKSNAKYLKHWKHWSRKTPFVQTLLETISKDAPWCADHFPYWMTTPSVLFGT